MTKMTNMKRRGYIYKHMMQVIDAYIYSTVSLYPTLLIHRIGEKSESNYKTIKEFFFFFFFFFYRGFSLSRTFTIHGTAGEGGGYLFNSSLPLPPAPQRRVERKERSQRKSKTELFTLAYKN